MWFNSAIHISKKLNVKFKIKSDLLQFHIKSCYLNHFWFVESRETHLLICYTVTISTLLHSNNCSLKHLHLNITDCYCVVLSSTYVEFQRKTKKWSYISIFLCHIFTTSLIVTEMKIIHHPLFRLFIV